MTVFESTWIPRVNSSEIGITEPATVAGLIAEEDDSVFDLVDPCPEVTCIPGWTPPLTLQVLDAAELAPKDEEVVYTQHAQIFRWRHGEWKERGIGDAMLLRHREKGSVRFLMWQDKTYRTIANFAIAESASHCQLELHEGDPRTWERSCQDYSDDCLVDEKFALHFKTEELAVRFKDVFDSMKGNLNPRDESLVPVEPVVEFTSAVGSVSVPASESLFEAVSVGRGNQDEALVTQACVGLRWLDLGWLGLVGLGLAWLGRAWLGMA